MVRQALDRRVVEQVAPVAQPEEQAAGELRGLDLQLELRRAAGVGQALEREAGERQRRRRRVLEGEEHLDERRPREIPLRRQLLDQALERQLLVGQRRQARLARPADELGDRGAAGEVGAEDQRVDEEADQPEDLRPAVRRRRPDEEVLLPGVDPEHRFDRGEDDHEERRSLGVGELRQTLRHPARQGEPALAGERARRRPRPGNGPRPVGGQLEDGGRAGERLAPEGELGGERRAG